MNIEEIKKKVDRFKDDWERSRQSCDIEDFSDEVLYLLSIIEKQNADIVTKDAALIAWMEREDKLKSAFDQLESKQLADQKAIIDQAEKALENISKVDLESDEQNQMKMMKMTLEALQAIRGIQ